VKRTTSAALPAEDSTATSGMHFPVLVPVPKHSSRDELFGIGALCDPFSSSTTASHVPSKPWTMYYFHKSGFLKDTHRVYLQFSDDGQAMRGRGIDGIGTFFMKGQVDVDIEGFSWHIDKCYLNLSVLGIIDDSSSSKLNEWVSNEAGEWISDSVLAGWGRSHVQQTGYVTGGVGVVMPTEASYQLVKRMALANSHPHTHTHQHSPHLEGLDNGSRLGLGLTEQGGDEGGSFLPGAAEGRAWGESGGGKMFGGEDRWREQARRQAELEEYRAFNSNW
jgi:hypothetical protein